MLNLTAGQISITTILTTVISVFAAAFPFTSLANEPNGITIRVLIENFRYEGKDAYSLLVATSNASSRDIRVTIVEEGFFIQTDRGWAQLKVRQQDREGGEFFVPALKKSKRTALLSIPLTIPQLFRTYEGDLSLMYKYIYTVRTAEGTGAALQRADEVYCWVRPGTSDWILREGM
jgi:hypothetical protein